MRIKLARGFTLIELLTVIAIIGILATIIMVSLQGAKAKSRDSRRIADIKSIQLALSLYYNDNGMYPLNIYCIPSVNGCGTTAPSNGLSPTYLPTMPVDPSSPSGGSCTSSAGTNGGICYKYMPYSVVSTNCSSSKPPVTYHLGAALEDTTNTGLSTDVDADNGGTYVYTGYSACTLNNAGQATFNGNAAGCSGTTAATPDACYDVAP